MKNITSSLLLLLISVFFCNAQTIDYNTAFYDHLDLSKAIAIAYSGCYIYVTGVSDDATTGNDYLTIKYDMNLNVVWTARYDQEYSNDQPAALAVDAYGNVFVTGTSSQIASNSFIYTIKYNSYGTLQWVRGFNNPNGNSTATSLVLGADQGVYVGGYSYDYVNDSSNNDFIVLKYYPQDGAPVWNYPASFDYNGQNDQLTTLAVDISGNVYAAGSSGSSPGNSSVVSFTDSGVQNQGAYINSIVSDITLDTSKNIYLASYISNQNINIYKYSNLNLDSITWSQTYTVNNLGINNILSSDYNYMSGQLQCYKGLLYLYANIDVDPSSNINYDAVVLKINPFLNANNVDTLWTNRYAGLQNDMATSLALDTAGNAYITGYTTNTSGNKDILMAEYATSNGRSVWSDTFASLDNGDAVGNQIVVNPENNILITGYTYYYGTEYFTRKYVNANTIPIANAGPAVFICPGTAVTIGSSGVSGYTYQWSPDSGLVVSDTASVLANPNATTLYQLTVSTSYCTQAFDTVTVTVKPLPSVTAVANPTSVCPNIPVILSGAGASTYVWTSDNHAEVNDTVIPINSTSSNQTVTYTITGTGSNGCSATASANVVVFNSPVANTGTGQLLCVGGTITLGGNPSASSGAPPYTYQWSNCSNLDSCTLSNPVFTAPTIGNYTIGLTVTDANSCTNTNQVILQVLDSLNLRINADTAICDGNSVDLQASGGESYLWVSSISLSAVNIANPIASPSTTTIYQVKISAPGCHSDTEFVTITVDSIPIVTLNIPDTLYTTSNPVTLTGGLPAGAGGSYTGAGVSGNTFSPAIAGEGNHFITYTYTNTNGCSNSVSKTIVVLTPTDILKLQILNLVIAPNPSPGFFTISFDAVNKEEMQIKVYDLVGRMIKAFEPINAVGAFSKELNLNNVSKGFYLLQIESERGVIIKKIDIN